MSDNIGKDRDEKSPHDQDPMLRGMSIPALVSIRIFIGLGLIAFGGYLSFFTELDSKIKTAFSLAIFSLGVGLTATFLSGNINFKYKDALAATGSCAIFLILYFVLRSDVLAD